jgi:hypothetical protein
LPFDFFELELGVLTGAGESESEEESFLEGGGFLFLGDFEGGFDVKLGDRLSD